MLEYTIASIPLLTDFVNNKRLNVLTKVAFATPKETNKEL